MDETIFKAGVLEIKYFPTVKLLHSDPDVKIILCMNLFQ